MKKCNSALLVLSCLAAVFITGCGFGHEFLRKDVKVNGRIGVIFAETKYKDISQVFVSKIEQKLLETTTFTVVTQDKIKKALPDYPEKIKGPYGTVISTDIKENYSKTDVASLSGIAKKIKVDYLYVIWIPVIVENVDSGSTVYQVKTVAQLFEFPSGSEVAHGKYEPIWASGLVIGAPRTPEEGLSKAAEAVVNDIGMNTNTLKTTK